MQADFANKETNIESDQPEDQKIENGEEDLL